MIPTLTFPETRVLGSLLEKETLTPEGYPLTLNSLLNACNQTTSREPVTALDEPAVQAALEALREKKLATVVFGAGSRVQKYRHNLPDHYALSPRERALLCCLLLRGPQTAGELRQRTERMAGFADLGEVERALEGLAQGGGDALVEVIPAGLGRKERRYRHRLADASGEPLSGGAWGAASPAGVAGLPNAEGLALPTPPPPEALAEELAALREGLIAAREELRQLREELAALRQSGRDIF